ncbi:MAG TPA: type I-U CRISPR-associated protein Csb2 [Polyangiaceae bacterium]|nr:type I-U CRISPR-associated protein Csb2 [Polyangiaceae bacterium]
MIILDVELLVGRYVATSFNDRDAPEWPPHPARLFSALVATAYEHEELTSSARSALKWLEEQGAPEIEASEAESRIVVATYVPGNYSGVVGGWGTAEGKLEHAREALAEAEASGDPKPLKAAQKAFANAEKKFNAELAKALVDDGKGNPEVAREMLPDRRNRQPRTIPAVTPHAPRVRYSWPTAEPSLEVKTNLEELARRLVRLGHSSSLVACRVLEGSLAAETKGAGTPLRRWRPTVGQGLSMRIVSEGQLERLEGAFEKHRGVEPRALPAVHQAYELERAEASSSPTSSVFGEWIVFREIASENSRRIGLKLSKTEDITRALRGALLSHADGDIPAVLSGHDEGGRPLERPHVAYVPLADIGSRYASGSVLGAAILLPRSLEKDERRAVLRAIGRWEENGLRLTLGRAGALTLERVVDNDPRKTLDPNWWIRPARRYGSVTPVALDRNPGNLNSNDPKEASAAARNAEEIVVRACQHVGLPEPRWVEIIRRSLFDAAPPARNYMPFPRKCSNGKGFSRVCVHVEMCFEQPVAGPVLIGAGRYFGVGLCRGRE